MRDLTGALRGMTTRGRCFVAAGLACAGSSLVLGERDLLRVAVLLVALPLAAAVVVARTRYRLSCSRRLEPRRVAAGEPARVRLRLDNVSRLPTSVLLMEDAVPFTLGTRPRFVLDRVEAGGRRRVGYTVRGDLRGRYRLGPLSVRLTDPFGFCEVARAFSAADELVVTPTVVALPPLPMTGERLGNGGESLTRLRGAGGEDDSTPRPYRRGDDLRRVHWRSTARVGELMVRHEEQASHSGAALLLDTRAVAHAGQGPHASFEWAVSAAASIACHLAGAGYAPTLVYDTGDEVRPVADAPEATLLDELAVVETSDGVSLAAGAGRLDGAGANGVVVVVAGALDDAQAAVLAQARGRSTGVALLVDVASWGRRDPATGGREGPRGTAGAAAILRGSGWQVITGSYGSSVADAWAGLGLPSAGAARAAPGARPGPPRDAPPARPGVRSTVGRSTW